MAYDFDNIDEWVAELAEKPRIAQVHTYARVVRDKEREDAERAILDKFDKNNARHGAKSVTIINEEMAVITFSSTKNETYHIPVVNGKPASYWFATFEEAILGAISLLKTDGIDAARYAAKVLDINA